MQKEKTCSEKQELEQAEDRSATWGGVRAVTQSVAFRVIGVNDDPKAGPSLVWWPSPPTEEEEAVLRGLRQLN